MKNLRSSSQPYSEEFEQKDQFQEDFNDNQRANKIWNDLTKQNKNSQGKIGNVGQLKIKLPLQDKLKHQMAEPIKFESPVGVNKLNNRLLLPKRPRQSKGSQNIDRKQFLQKINVNSQAEKRVYLGQKLPNLDEGSGVNEQNQFKKSGATNNRSDKMLQDSKNSKGYLFAKNKRKSMTSHVNSAHRYADEEGANSKNDISGAHTSVIRGNELQLTAVIQRTRQKMHFMSSRMLRSPKSHSHNNKSLNQITAKDEIIYKDPQNNSRRTVVFIKTYILSPFQSITLEISVLNGSIIIVGKLLGQQIDTLRLVINQQRSSTILAESFHDWEIVGKRIFIQQNQSGVKHLKIAPIKSVLSTLIKQQPPADLNENLSVSLSSQPKHKNILLMKQTQFLQRNYYSIINKNDQTLNTKQHSAINSINPSNQNTINHNQNNSASKNEKRHEKSPSIDIKEHLARQNKHLNYFSPQIRQKAQQYKKQKKKKLTKQVIQKKLQQREALAKRQQEQTHRLSKPKQTIQSKSKSNNKANNKDDRSVSKEKKINFRGLNRKLRQKEAIMKSINLKDEQSRINIKMSHLEKQADHKNNYKVNQAEQFKKQLSKKSKVSIKKKEDPHEWKEIELQKTDSIVHIKIEKDNSEDNYSQLQSQVSKGNQELSKNVKQKKPNGKQSISKGSENYYEDEDFEPQVNQSQTVKIKQDKLANKLAQKNLNSNPQKASEIFLVSVSNKQQIPGPKNHEKLQNQQQEVLIRDDDQDEYDQSFDQFKEDKPKQSKQILNKNYSHQQITKKSSTYDDQFENHRYVEAISNQIQDKSSESKLSNDYKQGHEQQNQQSYENILQENDVLDDNQIIKKIEQDYIDEEFDR